MRVWRGAHTLTPTTRWLVARVGGRDDAGHTGVAAAQSGARGTNYAF